MVNCCTITGSLDWLPDALLPPDACGFTDDLGRRSYRTEPSEER